MIRKALAIPFIFAAVPALADDPTGDAAEGERAFRGCISCHVVKDAEDNVLAGRNGRTGPNLYGMPGRAAGAVEDFRYSDGLIAAGDGGLVWDEETFVAFVQDPTSYIREITGDSSARSKMSYRVRKEEDAVNLYAYLFSLSPAAEAEAETAETTEESN